MMPDAPGQTRTGGADWLSLALIDARNRTLRWLAAFEAAPHGALQGAAGLPPALWLVGRAAWWQEHWIVRNVQAQRGEHGDPLRPRLASIDPQADLLYEAEPVGDAPWAGPPAEAVRAYGADTLEAVLELLAGAAGDDDGLYFYRLALQHEDRTVEALAALAQAAGVDDGPWAEPGAMAERPPLWLPDQRMQLGSAPDGLVPGNQRWAHAVAVPAFEIDAQPVTWARYVEFAQDGGYDEPGVWTDAGWSWAQAVQRRAPRYVEQLRQGVVRQHRGRLRQAGGGQPAVHLSRHEAEAWCRWAGRRLPTEPEWELAATGPASRGFAWGTVLEWVAGSARPWPGHAAVPGDLDPLRPGAGVLRGASAALPRRAADARGRRFVAPDNDVWPIGFRSCAM